MKETAIVDCEKCQGKGSLKIVNPVWLRTARCKAHLSVRQLALRLGYSATYLSHIERGRRPCSDKIRRAYASLVKVLN